MADDENAPELNPEEEKGEAEVADADQVPADEPVTDKPGLDEPVQDEPVQDEPEQPAEETPPDEESPVIEEPVDENETKPVTNAKQYTEKRLTGEEPKKPEKEKEPSVRQLFDSKGSLIETESFVREKLVEFKQKRAAVAKLISELQAKVNQYKQKENPTDDDIANLKKYHTEFLEKLNEYESMTRNLERLMGMADIPSSQLDMTMGPPISKPTKPPVEKPQRPSLVETLAEDKLPKLIVCGTDMGDTVPRIIVCEPLRKADLEPFSKDNTHPPEGRMISKLNECFEAQQKLAVENAEIAQMRYQLQQELLDKQDILDNMKQQMMALEAEKYRIANENSELQKRLLMTQKSGDPPMCKQELFIKLRGKHSDSCGPEISHQLENAQDLEEELEKMSGDVKNIYCELDNMQKDKIALGYPTSPKKPVCKRMLPQKSTQTDEDKEKDLFFESEKDPKYKDLREQYQRLHNDFKNKVTEVASLRIDLEKTRQELDDIRILHHELEEMHQKELDQNQYLMTEKNLVQQYKEQIIDLGQQANLAKQMFKSSQEEMEEMRSLIEEQASQLDEYRNKYMKTLQIAEELKRENEFKERECADQIAMEIQRVKLEMQEQLEELSPIKDLLKITQQKLKETEQMHNIALETIAVMSKQLQDAKNEAESYKTKIEATEQHGDIQENIQHSLEVAEKRMTELEADNSRLKEVVAQLESVQVTTNGKLEEKSHELLQMVAQLETLREESARQVSRVKERSDMIRKCLQAQIAEMEREVAQCRAAAAFANRERDEVKSKLQLEICLLSENFRESQNRIIQLQQHLNYLSASHPTSLLSNCF